MWTHRSTLTKQSPGQEETTAVLTEGGLCTRAWRNTELKLLKARVRSCQHSCTLPITRKVYLSHQFLLPKGELQRQTSFSPPLTYVHVFLMCLATRATTWLLRETGAYTSESRPHSHLDSIPRAACNSLKKVRFLPLYIWVLNRHIRTQSQAEFLR